MLAALCCGHAAAAEAELKIEESTVYYPVYGRNAEELLRTLRVPDGRGTEHGLTRSDFQVESSFVQDDRRCLVRDLTIRLKIRIDLPRWDDASSIPASLQEVWGTISERTQQHELKHRQNALDAAEELRRVLGERPPETNCAELSKALRRETSRVRARWELRDRLLDQRDVLHLQIRRSR